MAKSPQDTKQSYYRNIAANTGVSIPEWMARIRAQNFTRHSEIVNWLKTEHGLGHGHATLLAYDTMHGKEEG